MNKFLIIASIFVAWGFMVQCVSQKKASYDLPAAMSPTVRAEYVKQCDKGQILYEINCGPCHTKKVKGKKVIPDFSSEQLIGYELRISNPKHESQLSETSVTAEELGYIMTFLSYKTKNMAAKK